jgi:hypothetical protein
MGLKVCFTGADARANERAMESLIDADITLDADGCITSATQVAARGTALSARAKRLVAEAEGTRETEIATGSSRCGYYAGAVGSGWCPGRGSASTVYVDANDLARTQPGDGFLCTFGVRLFGGSVAFERTHILAHEVFGHAMLGTLNQVLAIREENAFRRERGEPLRCRSDNPIERP